MAHRPTVLVVEDEPSVQVTLCATLTLWGYRALHAGAVEGALNILGSEPVDAVILDVRLCHSAQSQETGLTLLIHLRATAEYASIPAVIFTGMPLSPEDLQIARRQNAEVFYKPERYSVLIGHLGHSLGHNPTA